MRQVVTILVAELIIVKKEIAVDNSVNKQRSAWYWVALAVVAVVICSVELYEFSTTKTDSQESKIDSIVVVEKGKSPVVVNVNCCQTCNKQAKPARHPAKPKAKPVKPQVVQAVVPPAPPVVVAAVPPKGPKPLLDAVDYEYGKTKTAFVPDPTPEAAAPPPVQVVQRTIIVRQQVRSGGCVTGYEDCWTGTGIPGNTYWSGGYYYPPQYVTPAPTPIPVPTPVQQYPGVITTPATPGPSVVTTPSTSGPGVVTTPPTAGPGVVSR